MDKKIKSVKFKNDYRTLEKFVSAGAELIYDGELWIYANEYCEVSYTESQILKNKTDLFNVEYHSIKKWITVKIEYEFNDYMLGIGDVIHAMRDYNEKRVLDKPEYFQNLKVTEIK